VTKCEECGHENAENEVICVKCGAPLIDLTKGPLSTRGLGDTDYEEGVPKWGSARFNATMNLILEVLETHQRFVFDAEQISEISIGRRDPDTGEVPPVDLSSSGALDKGVSRHHAMIMRRDGALHIVDNSSANGTYLNGQRLVARQPRILRDGDDIRLGHLVMRVTFKMGQPSSS
jgi:hypothetical protein